MKVLVSGASGFIGSALVSHLKQVGHQVSCLVRAPIHNASSNETILWDPHSETIDRSLEGFHAVIHLSGEPVFSWHWNRAKKVHIYQSRVQSTKFLVKILGKLNYPPQVFLCASAIGYYGNRGDDVLTEESSVGEGFLAGVSRDWEAAANALNSVRTRVVNLRFGLVLDPRGGVLARMLMPFRLGLGGRLGSGQQYISWITRQDLVRVIQFVLESVPLKGPVNVVSPNAVTQARFTQLLAKSLHRPAFFHLPDWFIRLAFGEAGRELFLAGSRVLPKKLQAAGFKFHYSDLDTAFEVLLK